MTLELGDGARRIGELAVTMQLPILAILALLSKALGNALESKTWRLIFFGWLFNGLYVLCSQQDFLLLFPENEADSFLFLIMKRLVVTASGVSFWLALEAELSLSSEQGHNEPRAADMTHVQRRGITLLLGALSIVCFFFFGSTGSWSYMFFSVPTALFHLLCLAWLLIAYRRLWDRHTERVHTQA